MGDPLEIPGVLPGATDMDHPQGTQGPDPQGGPEVPQTGMAEVPQGAQEAEVLHTTGVLRVLQGTEVVVPPQDIIAGVELLLDLEVTQIGTEPHRGTQDPHHR